MAVKVTLLFNAGTTDSGGNAARVAGFSESYYSLEPIDSATLQANWSALCFARAALLPMNTRICGSRYANVDPPGGTRSYDTVYTGTAIQNALPGKALQYTVRSAATPNQRSLILRGIPDARVVTGEYSPTPAYNAALMAFFGQLKGFWRFRAINRAVLPVKVVSISALGLVTTLTPHGMFAADRVNIMSTRVGDGKTQSYLGIVVSSVTDTTFIIGRPGRDDTVPASSGGRVRKAGLIYPLFSITDNEVINPTAIFRKVGSPFRKFRGRRTTNHR